MVLEGYLSIIGAFVDGRDSADAFEQRFLQAFKSESEPMSPAVSRLLDHLFGCVDAYCGDAHLRDDDDLDGDELLCAAREAQTALWTLAHARSSTPTPLPRATLLDFTPYDYVRHGGWQALPGERAVDFGSFSAHTDTVEGDAQRLVCIDGPMWSLEMMFGPKGDLTHDQLAIAPELAALDPERDHRAITLRLPFAYLDDVETTPAVAGIEIEAIFGDDPIEDESVVFLANGVNLHYQPTGQRSLLRLITNGADADARVLVRRVHTQRR